MTIDTAKAGPGQARALDFGSGLRVPHRGFSIGPLHGRLAEVHSNMLFDMFSIASLKVVLGRAPGGSRR